jgi:hypothetical protein
MHKPLIIRKSKKSIEVMKMMRKKNQLISLLLNLKNILLLNIP